MKEALKHIALKNRVFYNVNVDDFGIAYVSPKGSSYEECLKSAKEAAEEQKRNDRKKAIELVSRLFNPTYEQLQEFDKGFG